MFGCTCYELINKHPPYPEYSAIEAALRVKEQKLSPEIPNEKDWGAVSQVMKLCFQREPDKRPTFDVIIETLVSKNVKFYFQGSKKLGTFSKLESRESVQEVTVYQNNYGSV